MMITMLRGHVTIISHRFIYQGMENGFTVKKFNVLSALEIVMYL